MEIDPIYYQFITGICGILPYRLVWREMPELGVHATYVSVKGQKILFPKVML